jgi:hypothetical protein
VLLAPPEPVLEEVPGVTTGVVDCDDGSGVVFVGVVVVWVGSGVALAGGAVLAGSAGLVKLAGERVRVAPADFFSDSFTSAAPSTARDSTMRTPAMSTGARHFAGAAKRVLAAAPQRKHQSCSSRSGIEHNGHSSCTGKAVIGALIERRGYRRDALWMCARGHPGARSRE